MTEDEMIGWHHRLIGHEFEQTLVKDREAWCAAVYGIARVRHDLATEQQIEMSETSLMVQWLRLHTPIQGAQFQPLVRELDPTCSK